MEERRLQIVKALRVFAGSRIARGEAAAFAENPKCRLAGARTLPEPANAANRGEPGR